MATIRIFKHYIPLAFLYLGLLEGAIFIAAFYGGVEIRFWDTNPGMIEKIRPIFPKAMVFSIVVLVSMASFGLYERSTREGFEGLLLRVGGAFSLSIVPLALIFYIAPDLQVGRGAVAFSYLLAFIGVALIRYSFLRLGDQTQLKKRVLILGTGDRAATIGRFRRSTDLRGLHVVGFARMGDAVDKIDAKRIVELGCPLRDYIRRHDIDELVVAVDDRRKALPIEDILDAKMCGVQVVDLLTFFERELGKIKIDILHPSWMYLSDGFQASATRAYLKRLLDILIVLLMMPVALPLMSLTALAVWAESGFRGPILFRQIRVGQHGESFKIMKFRSMKVDAEKNGAQWAQRNDARVTRVGKLIRKVRLDELPQLLNVLRGQMSFVGPRPERPEFVDQLAEKIPYFHERHRVKPGLTGWAQVSYQYGASEEDAFEKLQYDLYYVKNYSVLLDLLILIQTVEVVLTGKGAH